MKHLIFLLTILALTVSVYGKSDNGTKAGTSEVHDNNNYWQTVWDDLSDGDPDGGLKSGEYPGGSGICNVYAAGLWVGLLHNSGYKVSTSFNEGNSEYVPETEIYTTGNWPSGFPLYGTFDTHVECNDNAAGEQGPIPITAARHTWSFSTPVLDDFVGFKYIVRNDSSDTYDAVYISHIVDYDVGGPASFNDDKVKSGSVREFGYMYDDTNGYFGVVCGTGSWTSVGMSYWENTSAPTTDLARNSIQRNAGWSQTNTPADYTLAYTFEFDGNDFEPGETIVAGFFEVAGATMTEFSNNINMAMDSYVEDEEGLSIKSASLGAIKATFR